MFTSYATEKLAIQCCGWGYFNFWSVSLPSWLSYSYPSKLSLQRPQPLSWVQLQILVLHHWHHTAANGIASSHTSTHVSNFCPLYGQYTWPPTETPDVTQLRHWKGSSLMEWCMWGFFNLRIEFTISTQLHWIEFLLFVVYNRMP